MNLTHRLVPIVGVETTGSACFYHSMQANRARGTSRLPPGATVQNVDVPNPWSASSFSSVMDSGSVHTEPTEKKSVNFVHLAKIDSRASSLGASSPSPGVVAMALERKGAVRTVTISDERCMSAALQFTGTSSFSTI